MIAENKTILKDIAELTDVSISMYLSDGTFELIYDNGDHTNIKLAQSYQKDFFILKNESNQSLIYAYREADGDGDWDFLGIVKPEEETIYIGPVKKSAQLRKIIELILKKIGNTNVDPEEIELLWEGKNRVFADAKGMEDFLIEKEDLNIVRDIESYEEKLLTLIKNGDIESLMELRTLNYEDIYLSHGKIDLKALEYLCCASVTLCCRAAIAGGVSPDEAYNLSDYYLDKLRDTKGRRDLEKLSTDMIFTYADLSRKAKRKVINPYVKKCKDYIEANLRKPFKVNEIANELGLNRSYLSDLFSSQEGISIQEYILRKKCLHASYLLRFSDYSISTISGIFCFSSQSYFTAVFKKIMGYTPKEYRMKYMNMKTVS